MMNSVRGVGIVGAGTMGNGIAQTCAVRRHPGGHGRYFQGGRQQGLATVAGSLDRLVKRKRSANRQSPQRWRITERTDYAALKTSRS